jgi:hypothetical protein
MKKYKRRYIQKVDTIVCDRCAIECKEGDLEFEEFASINYRGGYKSIFGDGHDISIDLCQKCLKETLGEWLTIGECHYAVKALGN